MSLDQTGADYVDWVLDQLAAMFGTPFIRENQVPAAGGQTMLGDRSGLWAAELKRVPAEWLRFGLNRYRDRIRLEAQGGEKVWQPTAVQFAAACSPTPEDLGYLPADRAWRVACQFSHQPSKAPAEIRAAAEGQWFDIRQATSTRAIGEQRKRFLTSYQGVINRALAGEDIAPRQMLDGPGTEAGKQPKGAGKSTDSLIERMVAVARAERLARKEG